MMTKSDRQLEYEVAAYMEIYERGIQIPSRPDHMPWIAAQTTGLLPEGYEIARRHAYMDLPGEQTQRQEVVLDGFIVLPITHNWRRDEFHEYYSGLSGDFMLGRATELQAIGGLWFAKFILEQQEKSERILPVEFEEECHKYAKIVLPEVTFVDPKRYWIVPILGKTNEPGKNRWALSFRNILGGFDRDTWFVCLK